MIRKINGRFSRTFESIRDFGNYISICVLVIAAFSSLLVVVLTLFDVPMFIEPNKSWFSPDIHKVSAPEHKYWLNLLWNLGAIPFVMFFYIRSFAVRDLKMKPEYKLWMALFVLALAVFFSWMQFSGFHGKDGRLSQGFATTTWGIHLSTHLIFYGFCFSWTTTLFYVTDKLGLYKRAMSV
ncbi:MAG: hypothetical protein HWE12_07070 [Oceanospirillaceae bacterium]|nr:hypothetical protein [Oceanospirillaceae bacterium]